MKKNKKGTWVLDIFILILLLGLISFTFKSCSTENEFCKEKGYNTKKPFDRYNKTNMENGFIKCCNDKIKNHTIIGIECDIHKMRIK